MLSLLLPVVLSLAPPPNPQSPPAPDSAGDARGALEDDADGATLEVSFEDAHGTTPYLSAWNRCDGELEDPRPHPSFSDFDIGFPDLGSAMAVVPGVTREDGTDWNGGGLPDLVIGSHVRTVSQFEFCIVSMEAHCILARWTGEDLPGLMRAR